MCNSLELASVDNAYITILAVEVIVATPEVSTFAMKNSLILTSPPKLDTEPDSYVNDPTLTDTFSCEVSTNSSIVFSSPL